MRRQISRSTITAMALLLSGMGCAVAQAEKINVIVVDPDGEPVPEIVVFVEQGGSRKQRAAPASAILDQRNKQFVPHVLVVQKGASVLFPNSDTVGHHVYSFSKPNNFILPLYTGDPHDPVIFDHDGIVMLGCNIHDHMLGYIVVVDTDIFGTTDASGSVLLDNSGLTDNYVVNIWSPRIRDNKQNLKKIVNSSSPTQTELTFTLEKKLRAPRQEHAQAVQWSEY